MNREQENRPDVAEQSMGQGNPEDPKAKFEGMVDKAKAGAKSENPHMRSQESRDARIGQLRAYVAQAEKQKAGFEELLAHRNEPNYVLKSESAGGAKVSSFDNSEDGVKRQIQMQEGLIEQYYRNIKDLSE